MDIAHATGALFLPGGIDAQPAHLMNKLRAYARGFDVGRIQAGLDQLGR